MKRSLSFILSLVLPLFPATAAEPAPRVRTSIGTSDGMWVGQRVPLVVELLAPGYFAGTATFDLPQVPGVLILPPGSSPAVASEDVNGVSYTVQRHELMIFSRRPGEVAIPPFEIRFAFKRQPLDPDPVAQSVTTAPVTYTARPVPGAREDEAIITSADLNLVETWKPEPGDRANPGDAFVRTLTWSASDVPGMAFPPFDPGRIEGLGIYPAEPQVSDIGDRGTIHGQRVDRVTYVCKTGGHPVIPPLTVRWWDPAMEEWKQLDSRRGPSKCRSLPPLR